MKVVELLYGLGGRTTSPGMVSLQAELEKTGCTVRAHDESDWQGAVLNAQSWPNSQLVLVGYSMGANNITYVAHSLAPRMVDLLVGIQPTLWSPVAEINNVLDVLLVNNPNVLETAGLGARSYTFSPSFKGHYEHIQNSDSHPYADINPAIHKLILDKISRL